VGSIPTPGTWNQAPTTTAIWTHGPTEWRGLDLRDLAAIDVVSCLSRFKIVRQLDQGRELQGNPTAPTEMILRKWMVAVKRAVREKGTVSNPNQYQRSERPRDMADSAGAVAAPAVSLSFAERVLKALDWPLTMFSLLIVPAIFLEHNSTSASLRYLAWQLNWAVWVMFSLEYATRLITAPDRKRFIRSAWLDLAIIAVSPPFGVPEAWQNVRAMRALRLLRLARAAALLGMGLRAGRRALRNYPFQFVLLVATATVFIGATGVFIAEEGVNQNIGSFGDAVWWAIVTVTTVGYGDVSPTTTEGRVLAVFMMLVGVGVIGTLTAALSSYLLKTDREKAHDSLHGRIDELETKLDRILNAIESREDTGVGVLPGPVNQPARVSQGSASRSNGQQ
jgi:voltage-gated potassium channel